MNPSEIDERLRRQRERGEARDRSSAGSRFERAREDIGYVHRFWIQFTVGCAWAWSHVGRPLTRAMTWIIRKIFTWYRQVWALAVYRRNERGILRLSKTRAGLFVIDTVIVAYLALNVLNVLYDTTVYALTAKHNETMYLTSSQEVDASGNVHAVKGCSSLPCSDEDSIYFRINPSGFNHLWALLHNHSIFFPDYVAAAVPPGTNECTVTTYGIRIKLLMRGFDLYPELLKASCKPVTQGLGHENPH